jgi:hypothetical protein
MKFTRTHPPTKYDDYHRYRPYTRADFLRVCAHCFRHEDEAGGEECFVQDHFEPKCRPNVDPADYFNLYWSCGICNGRRNKGNKWPTDEDLAQGRRFCDPCDHDPVGADYVEEENSRLKPLTPAGQYTVGHLRLNERRELLKLRGQRRSLRQAYLTRLRQIESAIAERIDRERRTTGEHLMPILFKLQEVRVEYEAFLAREPFMLTDMPEALPPDLETLLLGQPGLPISGGQPQSDSPSAQQTA